MTELESLNAQRERLGMPALTELPKTPQQLEAEKKDADAAKEQADKEAEAAKIEAKRIADEEAEAAKKKLPEHTEAVPAELNDDVVLAYLQKKNPKISSFQDLEPAKSEDDIKKEKEERESNKLAWGLKTGKVKKKDYENFIADSKDAKNLVFNAFAARVKKADPELDDATIAAQFAERYGLDKDESSWQYQQGQEELSILANQHLQKNYGSILSLESEFSAFETTQQQRQSVQSKILANAPAYKKDVEEVFSQVGTVEKKIGDKTYKIELPKEFIERSKGLMLSNEYVAEQIQKGWKKEDLLDLARNAALIENQDFIMQKVAEQYHLENQKGTRGIVADLGGRANVVKQTVDEKLKMAAERHGATIPATTP